MENLFKNVSALKDETNMLLLHKRKLSNQKFYLLNFLQSCQFPGGNILINPVPHSDPMFCMILWHSV